MADDEVDVEAVAALRKKRQFRKFTFRGLELDRLLEKCFDDNRVELSRKSNLYAKQIIAVINNKNEVEVWISRNCKERKIKDEFEYQIMRVNDGGNCHFTLKINLTRQNYSDLSINGDA